MVRTRARQSAYRRARTCIRVAVGSVVVLFLLGAGSALAPPTVNRPPVSYDGDVAIRFSGPRGARHVSYWCGLDRRHVRRCASPHRARLAPGRHTFRVQARDSAGRRSRFARTTVVVAAPAPAVAVGSQPVTIAYGGGSLWATGQGGGGGARGGTGGGPPGAA